MLSHGLFCCPRTNYWMRSVRMIFINNNWKIRFVERPSKTNGILMSQLNEISRGIRGRESELEILVILLCSENNLEKGSPRPEGGRPRR